MLKKSLAVMLVCFLFLPSLLLPKGEAVAAADTMAWYKATAQTQSNDLNDVTVNKSQVYVAVGDEGTVLASKDARDWTSAYLASVDNLKSVATDGKRFVAVGDHGALLSSADGFSWTKNKINQVFTIGELIPATDQKKHYADYSVNWKMNFQQAWLDTTSVIWDGKRFVAIATWTLTTGKRKTADEYAESSAFIRGWALLTSPDGSTWTLRMTDAVGSKLVYGGGKYVAMADRTVSVSTNLTTWKTVLPDAIKSRSAVGFNDMMYANGAFMAIGWDGNMSASTGTVYTSTDALSWQEIKNPKEIGRARDKKTQQQYGKPNGFTDLSMQSLLWDGKQYWIAGYNGMMLRSSDGKVWEYWADKESYADSVDYENTTGAYANINKLIYDGSRYLMVGNRGTIILSDRMTHAEVVRQRPAPNFSYIAYIGSNRYVAGGASGDVYESTDGYRWEHTELPYPAPYYSWDGLAVNGSAAILVGHAGFGDTEYFYSPRPGDWENKPFPDDLRVVSHVSYKDGKFYVYASNGYVTSSDGLIWSKLMKTAPVMGSVTSNGKVFVGLAGFNQSGIYEGQLYTSTDGKKWTKQTTKLNNITYHLTAESVLWNGKQFVTSGGYAVPITNRIDVPGFPMAATSASGSTWTMKKSSMDINHVATSGSQYVGVGKNGLFSSTDGLTYKAAPTLTNRRLYTVLWDGEKFIVGGANGTLLTSKKPPAASASAAITETTLKFNLHEDDNDPLVIEQTPVSGPTSPAATSSVTELAPGNTDGKTSVADRERRIAAVKQIGAQYQYQVVESTHGRDRIVNLESTESLEYQSFTGDEYANRLTFNVFFNGIDTRQINAASDIISLHTGVAAKEAADWLQGLIDGKTDADGFATVGGVSIQYLLLLNLNDNGNLMLQY